MLTNFNSCSIMRHYLKIEHHLGKFFIEAVIKIIFV